MRGNVTNVTVPKQKIYKSLLMHERSLLDNGDLVNITHNKSTSGWLVGQLTPVSPCDLTTTVYRPMGDIELMYLLEHKTLPTTQPYQAIIEGATGFKYSGKYLNGAKKVDTSPTTIVEFVVPKDFLAHMLSIQSKVEDGAISVGLGGKAGNCIGMFNELMSNGVIQFRIVKVKRLLRK